MVEEKGGKSQPAARLDDENDDARSRPVSNVDDSIHSSTRKVVGEKEVKGRVETPFCLLHRMGSASSNAHRIQIAQLWGKREREDVDGTQRWRQHVVIRHTQDKHETKLGCN